MRALVWHGPRRMTVDDLPEPEPGAGEVAVVIDAAGAAETRRLAVELLNPAGTAVFIGLHDDESALSWHRVVRGNHTVKGVFSYSDADYQQSFDWLSEGRAGIGDLNGILPLDEGPAAFATLAEGPTEDIKVFLGS